MKEFMKYLLLPLLAICSQAHAGTCEFSDWYISRQDAAPADWAGSVSRAAGQPDAWELGADWQLNRSRKFSTGKADLFAVTEIAADEDYLQGLTIVGSPTEVRINGKAVLPAHDSGVIYPLDLKKGKNQLEIGYLQPEETDEKAKKKPKSSQSIHMSLVDLEYIYTPVSKKLEYARPAIEYLGETYDSYDSEKYLKELQALQKNNASDEEVESFRYRALVAGNPELDFDQIMFRHSASTDFPANWRGNSHYLHRSGQEYSPKFDDSIELLNLKSGETEAVYAAGSSQEGLMDVTLHYSGEKFLYSGVDTETNTFQVYEMNIDGSGKRQITPYLPEIDNYNGIYLPSGKILFCSTASLNSVPCVGGKDYVGTLYQIDADGSGMRQVTFDQENDWYPWVKDTGRVMYHRWEYTDNSHYFTRILMEMNPDGTSNRSIYGSNSYWPNTMFYAKQIPGQPSQFSAIVSGHHGMSRAGELWVFDQDQGDFEGEGALRRIPGRGKTYEPVIIDKYAVGKWPLFLHPYPVSENFFLVSCKQTPKSQWELFMVDTFDNMIRLGPASDKHLYEPVPLKAREIPPVIPDRRDPEADDATLYIQDIYAGGGLEGIPRGEIAALRIFTYGFAYRMTGSHDALAIEGPWDTKRVLGTVPVEEDGSVMVKIPHSMPISLQPVDKNGRALQVMRSWLAAQPGETVSCVGCHEPSSTVPEAYPVQAFSRGPQRMTPWSETDKLHGFGFEREIQPILDRYCVGCHDGKKEDRPNFADKTEENFSKTSFGKSYMALHPYVRRPGPESDLHMLTPMDYHTSTSELFQMLEKGHHGVEVDDASMRRLAAWVDLNVPYHATWTEYRNDKTTRELAARTVEHKKLYASLDDSIEWMPPLEHERPEFIKPRKVEKPAPLTLEGWPFDPKGSLERKTVSFGKQELSFVRIPAGKFVMGSVEGAGDEYPQAVVEIDKPFWMSTTEITNTQFRQFDPEHDSRFIDQQWKDHIYAGYTANKDEMPAIRVTWDAAIKFTEWLSAKAAAKVNLPTEAQWEWAARAGSDQPYFFGESGFEEYANLADKNIGLLAVRGVDPKPIAENARSPLTDFVPRDASFDDGQLLSDGTAQYKPNPWGLYDMHGNVAEWTRTVYKPYPYDGVDGRNDVSAEGRRAVRGGSWRDRPKTATASHRLPYEAFQKVYNVGFRVIIEIE